MLVYKIVHHQIGIDPSIFTINVASATRGHNHKLYKPHASTNTSTVKDWNSLPNDIVVYINMFKNLLDDHWSHHFYDLP